MNVSCSPPGLITKATIIESPGALQVAPSIAYCKSDCCLDTSTAYARSQHSTCHSFALLPSSTQPHYPNLNYRTYGNYPTNCLHQRHPCARLPPPQPPQYRVSTYRRTVRSATYRYSQHHLPLNYHPQPPPPVMSTNRRPNYPRFGGGGGPYGGSSSMKSPLLKHYTHPSASPRHATTNSFTSTSLHRQRDTYKCDNFQTQTPPSSVGGGGGAAVRELLKNPSVSSVINHLLATIDTIDSAAVIDYSTLQRFARLIECGRLNAHDFGRSEVLELVKGKMSKEIERINGARLKKAPNRRFGGVVGGTTPNKHQAANRLLLQLLAYLEAELEPTVGASKSNSPNLNSKSNFPALNSISNSPNRNSNSNSNSTPTLAPSASCRKGSPTDVSGDDDDDVAPTASPLEHLSDSSTSTTPSTPTPTSTPTPSLSPSTLMGARKNRRKRKQKEEAAAAAAAATVLSGDDAKTDDAKTDDLACEDWVAACCTPPEEKEEEEGTSGEKTPPTVPPTTPNTTTTTADELLKIIDKWQVKEEDTSESSGSEERLTRQNSKHSDDRSYSRAYTGHGQASLRSPRDREHAGGRNGREVFYQSNGAQRVYNFMTHNAMPHYPGVSETKLGELLAKYGYCLELSNGQRKYGPSPSHADYNLDGPAPHSEIFVGRIPREVFEDELVPLFETIGKVYDLRLMIDPLSGYSRGYAFISYFNKEDATSAVEKLNDYEIRPQKHLKVKISVPNVRLFIGNIPKQVGREEIYEEFHKQTGLVDVILYQDPGNRERNRGFCFLEFESHKLASQARRKLISSRVKIWGIEILVDWAEPLEEPDEETMSKVKVIYVRNLSLTIPEEEIQRAFEVYGPVERVKKIKDYAFVHFEAREVALKAMEACQGRELLPGCGHPVEISLARPPSDKKRKEEILRNRERRLMNMMQSKSMFMYTNSFHDPPPSMLGPHPQANSVVASTSVGGVDGASSGVQPNSEKEHSGASLPSEVHSEGVPALPSGVSGCSVELIPPTPPPSSCGAVHHHHPQGPLLPGGPAHLPPNHQHQHHPGASPYQMAAAAAAAAAVFVASGPPPPPPGPPPPCAHHHHHHHPPLSPTVGPPPPSTPGPQPSPVARVTLGPVATSAPPTCLLPAPGAVHYHHGPNTGPTGSPIHCTAPPSSSCPHVDGQAGSSWNWYNWYEPNWWYAASCAASVSSSAVAAASASAVAPTSSTTFLQQQHQWPDGTFVEVNSYQNHHHAVAPPVGGIETQAEAAQPQQVQASQSQQVQASQSQAQLQTLGPEKSSVPVSNSLPTSSSKGSTDPSSPVPPSGGVKVPEIQIQAPTSPTPTSSPAPSPTVPKTMAQVAAAAASKVQQPQQTAVATSTSSSSVSANSGSTPTSASNNGSLPKKAPTTVISNGTPPKKKITFTGSLASTGGDGASNGKRMAPSS